MNMLNNKGIDFDEVSRVKIFQCEEFYKNNGYYESYKNFLILKEMYQDEVNRISHMNKSFQKDYFLKINKNINSFEIIFSKLTNKEIKAFILFEILNFRIFNNKTAEKALKNNNLEQVLFN